MRICVSAVSLLAGVVTLAAAPVAGAAPSAAVLIGQVNGTGCVEPSVIVSVPRARAQSALPAGFRAISFYGDAGSGTVLAGVESCAGGAINGVPVPSFAFGERVVQVRPRSSRPGFQFYALQQVTSRPDIQAMLTQAGFDVELDPAAAGIGGRARAVASGGSARVQVDWPFPFISPLSTVTIWRGDSRLEITVTGSRSQAGIGSITAKPGSVTANALGAVKAWGVGAVNRYDMQVKVFAAPAGSPSAAG